MSLINPSLEHVLQYYCSNLVSNHVIISLIEFVSRFTIHLYNAIYYLTIFSTSYKLFKKFYVLHFGTNYPFPSAVCAATGPYLCCSSSLLRTDVQRARSSSLASHDGNRQMGACNLCRGSFLGTRRYPSYTCTMEASIVVYYTKYIWGQLKYVPYGIVPGTTIIPLQQFIKKNYLKELSLASCTVPPCCRVTMLGRPGDP